MSSIKERKDNDLWILMPAYNEELTIKTIINRTKKITKNILVVNDGSTDKTESIIKQIKNVELINIGENSGKANALWVGINFLKKMKAKKVVTIDADLQHLPEEIPDLLKVNADIVIGSREKNKKTMPFLRRIGNYIASKIVSSQTKMNINDPQSGFRVYSKRAINELSFSGKNFNIEKKILNEASEKNFIIREVPISCVYDKDMRKSYFGLKDILDFFKQ